MKLRFSLLIVFALSASAAMAVDFGVHGGYYGNDLKQGFVGADLVLPFGPIAIVPNVDVSQSGDIIYWIGSADVDLMYKSSGGPSYWIGAGPAYGYFTGYAKRSHVENVHTDAGWTANAGFGWTAAGFKPYVTGRYVKIENFKALGAAIGLRF
jgi:hypothetical protein